MVTYSGRQLATRWESCMKRSIPLLALGLTVAAAGTLVAQDMPHVHGSPGGAQLAGRFQQFAIPN